MMTVAKLIKALQELPPGLTVMIRPPEGDDLEPTRVEIEVIKDDDDDEEDPGEEVVNIIVW